MTGYRYVDGHVKLGSKIHVDDFVYAKRLFQNSYYALRFGFQVASFIDRKLDEWLLESQAKSRRLCILGYGLYSELTVSTAVRLLQLRRPAFNITHALVSDIETGRIEDESNLRERDIVLVIPIASTLSTAMKVHDFLRGKEGISPKAINPPLNIIVAGHKDLEVLCDHSGIVTDSCVSRFWKKVDGKSQTIITMFPQAPIQTFLLYTAIGWQLPESCVFCYPERDNIRFEKPLLMTDRASVTPFVILGHPKGKRLPETPSMELASKPDPESCMLDESMIRYAHIKRGRNHYLYYIDTQEMIRRNESPLRKWCETVKRDLYQRMQNGQLRDDMHAFLVAPAHLTNTTFISYVNNYVFEGTATIFYYEPDEDFPENIGKHLLKELPKNAHIFLVDDALCTGRTFYCIHNLIKTQLGKRGVAGLFVLLNRLDHETQEIILKDVNGMLYACTNIEAPVVNQASQTCYLCKERERYDAVRRTAVLDSTKIRYRWSTEKLAVTDVFEPNIALKSSPDPFNRYKVMGASEDKGRYFRKLIMGHRLLSGFTADPKALLAIFTDVDHNRLNDLLSFLGFEPGNDEHRANLLKLISEPQFALYSVVRRAALSWILMEFEVTFKAMKHEKGATLLRMLDLYRYFKLLLKRLARLKSGAIIRIDILRDVVALHDRYKRHWRKEIVKEIERRVSTESAGFSENARQDQLTFSSVGALNSAWSADRLRGFLSSMDNFNLYYARAVKESVYDDEAKALVLERALNQLTAERDSADATGFRSLIRILRIENVNILRGFLEWSNLELTGKVALSLSEEGYSGDVEAVIAQFAQAMTLNHYRAASLVQHLGFASSVNDTFLVLSSEEFIERIIPLILLRKILEESQNTVLSVEVARRKLQYILFLLCRVLSIKPGENGGAFCVARCGVFKPMEGQHSDIEEVGAQPFGERNILYDVADTFSYKMLKGYWSEVSRFPWSNIELRRSGEHFESYGGVVIESDYVPEALTQRIKDRNGIPRNHLFFVRLADDGINLDDPGTGVLVFYNQEAQFEDEKQVRYVMLFRNELSEFVKRNFNNDHFRSWLFEQRESTLIDTMHHGFERELADLRRIVIEEKYESHERLAEDFKILYRALYSKIPYALLTKELIESGGVSVPELLESRSMAKARIPVRVLLQEAAGLAEFVFSRKVGGRELPVEVRIVTGGIESIVSYKELVYDALFEVIRNAKAHVDEHKLYGMGIKPLLVFGANRNTNGWVDITVKDNGVGADADVIGCLNRYGWYGVGRGLKMFGHLWVFLMGKHIRFAAEPLKFFKVTLPLGVGNE